MAADDEWDIPTTSSGGGGSYYTGLGSGPGQFDPTTAPGWGLGIDPAFAGPQPTDTGRWDTGGSTSFGSKLQQLGSAMGQLTGGLGGAAKTPGSGSDGAARYPTLPNAPTPPGSSGIGRPSAPISLDTLLQMLMQRRNAYLQAANLNAQPVAQSLPKGVLGI